MQAAGGIGRFGGLAIALGVGAAVATGAGGMSGVAAAAPADDSASTGDSPADLPSTGSPRATSHDGATRRADRKPPQRQRRNDTSRPAAAMPSVGKPAPAPRVKAPAIPDVTPRVQPTAAPSPTQPAAAVPPPDRPYAAQPIALPAAAALLAAAPVVGTLQAVPTPFTGTGPGSPAESTASWVLLAAVRRTGRPRSASPAAATVSTGQALNAAATGTGPFAARFSNRTPAMAPGQISQGPTGEISGNLNAVDGEGDPLAYTVSASPAHGTVNVDSTGHFLYTPDKASAHTGVTDNFTVTVSDAGAGFHIHGFEGLLSMLTSGRLGNPGHTATRTVTVTVSPVNAAPTATSSVGGPDPVTGVVVGRIAGVDADGDPLSYSVSQVAGKGSVVVGADGSFSYTASAAARHASASMSAVPADKVDGFTVTVTDGHGGSLSVPVTVAVGPVNAGPTATSSVGVPDAGTGVVVGRITGVDADGDPLSYSVSQAAAKGTVSIAAGGSFTYTPTALARHIASLVNATQADRADGFTVTVTDGHGGSLSVPVTVAVSPVNAGPTATSSVGVPDAGTGVVGGRIAGVDADGDPLSYNVSQVAGKGSVVVGTDGGFSYTPTAAARHAAASPSAAPADKVDAFTVTVTDGHGGSVSVPLTVTIAPVNAAPTATSSVGAPDSVTGVVTGRVTGADADGDPLSYSGSGVPAKGSVAITADGGFSYTPSAAARHAAASPSAAPAEKVDAFTVTVTDGHGGSVSVPLTVTIAPVNAAPTATSSVGTPDGITGVVAGAVIGSDPDGDPLSYSVSQAAAKGTVSIAAGGSFTYTPTALARHIASLVNATQADRADGFTVTVTDGHGGSVSVPVTVTIAPVNATPTATSSVGTPDGITGVVAGAVIGSDPDGDPLSYSVSQAAAKGTAAIAASGSFTYTPTALARHVASLVNATQADRADGFTVTVTDGHGGSLSVPVTVAVGPVNAGPTATSSVGTPDGITGVVAGAVIGSDPDGDPLSYSVSQAAAKGAVSIAAAGGSFTYTPTALARHVASSVNAAPADRADGFTVTVTDGHGGSLSVPVTVAVGPVNAAPTATSSVGTPDGITGVVAGAVIGSDSDGDPLSYSVSQVAGKGSVAITADGGFSYTPSAAARHAAASPSAAPAEKVDGFTVTVADGHGGSVSVPVTVTVSPVNAAPTATSSVGTPDGITGVVAGAVIGSDPNGDPLSYSVSQAAAKGTVAIAADGSFTYTPTALGRHVASLVNAAQADATDSFTVTVADGYGAAVDVPVDVVISPASIAFNFIYGTGSQYWSDPARAALQSAASRLAAYIVVSQPVTVTYDVVGQSNVGSNLLATAWVKFGSSSPGYYGTVVQTKVLTGVDANGTSTDSQISVNFAYPWALGNTVPNNQYDFQSVAMHELVHTLGILSGLGSPSSIDRNWTTYDSYLATAAGASPIGSDYVWNAAYNPNLTGGNGGLYFAGPNAEAAYGGPVPLYLPGTWASGSSLSHLDPAHAPAGTTYLMDPSDGYGPGVRVLTPIEAGMLADLGYTIYQGPVYAVFFLGLRLRRRRPDQARTSGRLS